jgi:hypothetical protein
MGFYAARVQDPVILLVFVSPLKRTSISQEEKSVDTPLWIFPEMLICLMGVLRQFLIPEAGFVSLRRGVFEIRRSEPPLKIGGDMHQLRDAGLYQHSP